ncbi:MAG: HIT family protein [Pseudomonadota bacterium]
MFGLGKTWEMDPRLARDTVDILTHGECRLVLMNDARWPWLIVIPMIPDVEELHDLPPARADAIMQFALHVSRKMQALTGADKMNVAAIGNMVRQLHIHVVARSEGDPNWPAPVWGYGTATPYDPVDRAAHIEKLKEALRV